MKTTFLDARQRDQISTWIGFKPKFVVLYKSSVDGLSNAAFHNLCNGKDKVLTVVKFNNGAVFGGYISSSWHSSSAYSPDENAWLFRLHKNDGSWAPLKLLKRPGHNNTFYGNAGNGPTFGDAQDLYFNLDAINSSSSNVTNSHGYILPAGESATTVLAGQQNGWGALFGEMEVISIGQKGVLFPPFNPDFRTAPNLVKKVNTYAPKSAEILDIGSTNVLIVGGAGAGKSTFINSLFSAMEGRIVTRAITGGQEDHISRTFTKYRLTKNVSLWDTWGWSVTNYKVGELEFMLDGMLPSNWKMDTVPTFHTPGINRDATLKDAIHCIIIFVPALDVSDPGYLTRLNDFIEKARSRSLQCLLVLSRSDEYDLSLVENPDTIYSSEMIRSLIEDIFEKTGIPLRDIIPCKSYSQEYEVTDIINYLCLYILNRALDMAEDFFRNKAENVQQ